MQSVVHGDLAGVGAAADGAEIVVAWQAAIRRVLLVAHVLPAVFGLVAVSALEDREDVFPLAVLCWLVVLAWSLFLAVAGWNRVLGRRALTWWVLADALVMAGLMFVGTPARGIVSYIAVDGALFAAAFVSTRLALAQIGIVYGALWAAAAARHAGWDVPSPLIGWLTPLVVALAGVLALSFIRSALNELELALDGRHRALEDERRLRALTAREDALVRDLGALDEQIAPELGELRALSARYGRAVAGIPGRRDETLWLAECVGLATRELESLRDLAASADEALLDEVVEAAILRAGGALLADGAIAGDIDPDLVGLPLPDRVARPLGGFVREAVNNAVIHGGRPVTVSARRGADGGIVVAVADGGPGFDPGAVVRGQGLDSLAGYAAALGAGLEHRRTREGYAIVARIPEPA